MKWLNEVFSPSDVRKLPKNALGELAQEIREFILDAVSVKEGHLGAGLGVVELCIALHYVFNTPEDVLVWDVGHQAYPHKILTGRKDIFHTNRQWKGLSGFPKRSESIYDAFGTGHSSTSISAVLGMATASALRRNFTRKHIAIIGDASFVSGMSFEALNQAGESNVNMLIILNDNQMGIDATTGAFKDYLKELPRGGKTFFDALKINFLGTIDGHSLKELLEHLEKAKTAFGVQLLHIRTKKGKGLRQAEEEQTLYHAPGKFNRHTGDIIQQEKETEKYQDVFGKTLLTLARKNPKIVGITPAMLTGSSLHYLKKEFPERTFDVGIAEQHAITFAAGLASDGFLPFCVIYSTFLQRGYDQLIHDVALQGLKVIFCIDRAGLVGEDGATHQGIFDIAYLRCIPNLYFFAPRNEIELQNILYSVSQDSWTFPTAIRYPRGNGFLPKQAFPLEKITSKSVLLKEGIKYAVLSIGTIAYNVEKAIGKCNSPDDFAHYDIRWIKPLDKETLHFIFQKYQQIITIEDGCKIGGFGSAIAEFMVENNYSIPLKIIGIPDEFIEQGSVAIQQQYTGLSIEEICKTLNNL
ncbi:MAG: 1-deoxy-D-xylulose-5-phosphate synthase [Capnocytophaga sp.]|nr:1-deoxy-D-xylulose-5-phosphate synthase [Capnocytophaga sp.]